PRRLALSEAGDKLPAIKSGQRIVQPFEADRRARPAAHPLAAWPLEGPTADCDPIWKPEQPAPAIELGCCISGAEVRAAHVDDQQGIGGEHHGGLWAARRIHDEERDELRSMPRGVQDAETKLPKLQLLPIAERAKRIGRARRFVQAQLRAMRGR